MGQAACHTISSNQARLLEQEATMAEVKKQYGTVMVRSPPWLHIQFLGLALDLR
jgi:hypothetical protein